MHVIYLALLNNKAFVIYNIIAVVIARKSRLHCHRESHHRRHFVSHDREYRRFCGNSALKFLTSRCCVKKILLSTCLASAD